MWVLNTSQDQALTAAQQTHIRGECTNSWVKLDRTESWRMYLMDHFALAGGVREGLNVPVALFYIRSTIDPVRQTFIPSESTDFIRTLCGQIRLQDWGCTWVKFCTLMYAFFIFRLGYLALIEVGSFMLTTGIGLGTGFITGQYGKALCNRFVLIFKSRWVCDYITSDVTSVFTGLLHLLAPRYSGDSCTKNIPVGR